MIWTVPESALFHGTPERLWSDSTGKNVFVQTARTIAEYDISTMTAKCVAYIGDGDARVGRFA